MDVARRSRRANVVPKSFDFVEVIPHSGAGKILKGLLRAPYWAGRDRRI